MRYDNVIFFNYFHLGDIHISRNYIKEMMSRIQADTFFETNQYGDHVIKDIDNLHYLRWHSFLNFCGIPYDMPFAVTMNGDKKTLFINTWVAQNQPLNKIPKEEGTCTFPRNTENYNIILRELELPEIPKDSVDVFPSVDYERYDIDGVNNFLKKNGGPFVLVFNNESKSGQSVDFDFDPIVKKLCDEYKDHKFIFSNGSEFKHDRVYNATDIIGKNDFDLNELSYLSTFCDVMVGRNSGPQAFCYVIENFLCPNKKNMVISDFEKDADYQAHIYKECQMKTRWMRYGDKDVFEFMKEFMDEN